MPRASTSLRPGGTSSVLLPGYDCLTDVSSVGTVCSGSDSGGAGGGSAHDSNGRPISTTCMAAAGGGVPCSTWLPFAIPSVAPDIPTRFAELSNAQYSAKDELLTLALDLYGEASTRSRTLSAEFDELGRQTYSTIVSNEAGGSDVTREFGYAYDITNGIITRVGPDEVPTTMHFDIRNRLTMVTRGSGTPVMAAAYEYYDNGLLALIRYDNDGDGNVQSTDLGNTEILYDYDDANRLTSILHFDAAGYVMLRLAYTYYDNDLPHEIIEYAGNFGSDVEIGRTTFVYDRRGRLTSEVRTGNAQTNYNITYVNDKGGNRTQKIATYPGNVQRRIDYVYDLSDPGYYGTKANRLVKYVTTDIGQVPAKQISTTYYDYRLRLDSPCYDSGNPTRIITEIPPQGSIEYLTGGGEENTVPPPQGGTTGGLGGEGGMAMVVPGCSSSDYTYKSIRFGYAENGRTVTFVHDEEWCTNSTTGAYVSGTYDINWAREFRYDGPRQRYFDRELDPGDFENGTVTALNETWSDYDGENIYGDYEVDAGSVTQLDAREPGTWHRDGSAGHYFHNDHLGTLRRRTDSGGDESAAAVFTAFGERIDSGAPERYDYVGTLGYHKAASETPGDVYVAGFSFVHIGRRYYDPNTGRFLQRDPIGIRGGTNVYAYVFNSPLNGVDPEGEWVFAVIGVVIVVVAAITAYNYLTGAASQAPNRAANRRKYRGVSGDCQYLDDLRSRGPTFENTRDALEQAALNTPGTSLTGSPNPIRNLPAGIVWLFKKIISYI